MLLNDHLTRLRALGERATALLKTRWKALQHVTFTLTLSRIGEVTRA